MDLSVREFSRNFSKYIGEEVNVFKRGVHIGHYSPITTSDKQTVKATVSDKVSDNEVTPKTAVTDPEPNVILTEDMSYTEFAAKHKSLVVKAPPRAGI